MKALQVSWLIVAAISCFGFFCIFAEKHVELRKEKGNELKLAEKKPQNRQSRNELSDSGRKI